MALKRHKNICTYLGCAALTISVGTAATNAHARPGSEKEDLGEAEPLEDEPFGVSSTFSTDSYPMGPANANRTVIDGATNHIWLVYRDQDAIWIAYAREGVYWSSPIQVSPPGHSTVGAPMITQVGGSFAVAWLTGYDIYTGGGNMHYRVVSKCGAMTPTVDLGWGRDPSMTSVGGDVMFVHASGSSLRYDEFPAYSPALGSGATTSLVLDTESGGPGTHTMRFPSIEVTQGRAYVGYHYGYYNNCNSDEKIRAGYVDLATDTYTAEMNVNGGFLCTPFPYDLSLAADPDTGDVYMAYTIDIGTKLAHRDVNTGTWTHTSHSFDPGHVDLDASAGELLMAENVNQLLPTKIEVRRGHWWGAAAAPTWTAPLWTSSYDGREPEALLWRDSALNWPWGPSWSCQAETIAENVDSGNIELHRTCTGPGPALPWEPDWCSGISHGPL